MTKFIFSFFLIFQFNLVFAETAYIPLKKTFSDRVIIGSAVQWNEEYAVTAKHNSFAEDVVYKCPNSCDIMFIKRKATDIVPKWREPEEGENLTFVGSDPKENKIISKGKDLKSFFMNAHLNKDIQVYIASNQTEPGMSGGPVYGDDGNALGILTSGILEDKLNPELKKLNDGKMVTLYIPYSEIQKQWDIFQKNP